MHLSSLLTSAIGFASVALAAPQLPLTILKAATGCPYTTISKYSHGLTPAVREYSAYVTKLVTVDCHGCTEIVQQTLFIRPGGGYTSKPAAVRTIKVKEGVTGTKKVFVCRTGAPADKPAIQAKPMPKKLSWGKDSAAKNAPVADAPVKQDK
ncbi:hypothetical protein TWF281_001574 [Arthrobotrys megalospora]